MLDRSPEISAETKQLGKVSLALTVITVTRCCHLVGGNTVNKHLVVSTPSWPLAGSTVNTDCPAVVQTVTGRYKGGELLDGLTTIAGHLHR